MFVCLLVKKRAKLVLDEGHQIKNPAKQVTKACRALKAPHRILMTGTPIINNLRELWVLFDWATQGALLGDNYAVFKREYEDRIVAGNMQNASAAGKSIYYEKNWEKKILFFFSCFLKQIEFN